MELVTDRYNYKSVVLIALSSPNEYHRSVLHVLEVEHARMLGLLPLDSGRDHLSHELLPLIRAQLI